MECFKTGGKEALGNAQWYTDGTGLQLPLLDQEICSVLNSCISTLVVWWIMVNAAVIVKGIVLLQM